MKFVAPTQWQPSFVSTAIYDHLNRLFGLSELTNWPSLAWLNGHADGIKNLNNKQICFVPDETVDWQHGYYEEVIYKLGTIPTRSNNWHDFFGALIWLLFPQTKALLNQRHIDEITRAGLSKRTKTRNAITLFDECGLVIVCNDDTLTKKLQTHEWKNAFIENKNEWHSWVLPFMFGHANYEMATKPFLGLTAKALYLTVPHKFYEFDLKAQYHWLDSHLAMLINNENILKDNTRLFPLPFLGIPNWYGEQNNEFYENVDYFRPKRTKAH